MRPSNPLILDGFALRRAGTQLAVLSVVLVDMTRSNGKEGLMKRLEYMLSVLLALLVLAGTVAWTQAASNRSETALSCRPGRAAAPVFLKGMSVYPRCPGGKRG